MIDRRDMYDIIVDARQDMTDDMNEAFCNNEVYSQQYYYGADKMLRNMLWAIENTEQQKFTQDELREMIKKEREGFAGCNIEAMLDGISMAEECCYIWVEVLEEV